MGGEVGTPAAFQLAFNFGSEHQISGEIFSSDRVVSQPENVFKESFFETLAKVDNPPPIQVNRTVGGMRIQTPSLEEIFGSKIEPVKTPSLESPVSPRDFGLLITEKNLIEEEDFPASDLKENGIRGKKRNLVLTGPSGQTTPLEEKSTWQIILGEVEKSRTKEGNEVAVEVETEALTQTDTFDKNGRDEKIAIATDKMSSEELETPKEPLWELSAKKEKQEEVAKRVLARRINVAREIVEESAKEMAKEGNMNQYSLAAKVATRLGKIDTPTFTEAVGIIFGRLIFPSVVGIAQKEMAGLKPDELTPEGVLKSLRKTLVENPPLKPKEDEMEKEGRLPQSKLEKVTQEAAVLAQEGAEHIIYDPQTGKWRSVPKKPSQYLWEVDKTRRTVPTENSSIDRDISPWYTIFAKRAEARATRRNTKTQ